MYGEPGVDDGLNVHLQKRYRSEASSFHLDIDFTARPGVTIFLGHSGAGKSTILRCIAGLSTPEAGRIAIGNRTLFDADRRINLGPAERKIAFVFQDLALFPHLTVERNVAYGLRKLPSAEQEHRIGTILESFHIRHLRKRLPREISGGEQQRVALARSLVTEPSALLLDEPLSSLDIHTKADIIEDLRAWNEARRIPMLYVTHNHEEVFALGERVIVLEQGRIAAEGAPLEVVPTPRRGAMAQIAGFENVLEAMVIDIHDDQAAMVCRLAGTAIKIHTPLTKVEVGTQVYIGIRADEILLAGTLPKMIGPCNLIRARVKQVKQMGMRTEVRMDCGAEFRIHLPTATLGASGINVSDEAWMLIGTHSCHLIQSRRVRPPQRLLVFVCNGNTSHSPLAQAICNKEIALRLGLPPSASAAMSLCAVSAGLSANLGDALTESAQQALERMDIPVPSHQSQNLNAGLAARAEFIFCMTDSQRKIVRRLFPEAASKTFCLLPGIHLDQPGEQTPEGLLLLGQQIYEATYHLMDTLIPPSEIAQLAEAEQQSGVGGQQGKAPLALGTRQQND